MRTCIPGIDNVHVHEETMYMYRDNIRSGWQGVTNEASRENVGGGKLRKRSLLESLVVYTLTTPCTFVHVCIYTVVGSCFSLLLSFSISLSLVSWD